MIAKSIQKKVKMDQFNNGIIIIYQILSAKHNYLHKIHRTIQKLLDQNALIYLPYIFMSQTGDQDGAAFQKYLQTSRQLFKRVREFDYRRFFQDIITFLSIVLAYFIISLTYQFHGPFQKLVNINLKSADTIPLLSFIFSLYLIFWNLVAYFLKRRALRPPPRKDEYEEAPSEEPQKHQELPPLPNGQKYVHDIIYQSINQTVYLILLLVSIAAYAYLNQPSIPNLAKLVDVERINYIGIWFLASRLLILFGSLFGKLTKMREWKVLGLAMGYIVGFLILGLANGINTFIFI